jgi:hypothetical protein
MGTLGGNGQAIVMATLPQGSYSITGAGKGDGRKRGRAFCQGRTAPHKWLSEPGVPPPPQGTTSARSLVKKSTTAATPPASTMAWQERPYHDILPGAAASLLGFPSTDLTGINHQGEIIGTCTLNNGLYPAFFAPPTKCFTQVHSHRAPVENRAPFSPGSRERRRAIGPVPPLVSRRTRCVTPLCSS